MLDQFLSTIELSLGEIKLLKGELKSSIIDYKNNKDNVTTLDNRLTPNDASWC